MCCFVIEYEWLLHKTKICDTNINFKSGGWEIDFWYQKKKKKKNWRNSWKNWYWGVVYKNNVKN
jgi:hypothetical protein